MQLNDKDNIKKVVTTDDDAKQKGEKLIFLFSYRRVPKSPMWNHFKPCSGSSFLRLTSLDSLTLACSLVVWV